MTDPPRSGGRRSGLPHLLLLICLLPAVAWLAAACGEDEAERPREAGIKLVTSTEVFADLIRPVAGDRAQVIALVPGGGDPHTYAPVPSRVVDVSEADLVLINGLGLERTLADIIENNVGGGVPVIEMSAGLPVLDAGDRGTGNPHLWLNVRHAMHYVEVARDALVEADPEGEPQYRANAQDYLAELEDLDREVEEAIASIPAERRKLVTFHDAFPYLAERYGLEVVGVVVRSPGRQPSAGEVADLARRISGEDVPAVFKEPQLSARILELAAEDAGVEVCTLHSGAFQDEVDTYPKLMRQNADELVRCLGE
jgi:ABC-type Zn uptake system ZnuABC Zn-binding protein ZnuA